MKAEPNKVLKLTLRAGNRTEYGVLKGAQYFILKPIRTLACNCIVRYELEEINSDDILKWEYPENQKYLNDLYSEYLEEN